MQKITNSKTARQMTSFSGTGTPIAQITALQRGPRRSTAKHEALDAPCRRAGTDVGGARLDQARRKHLGFVLGEELHLRFGRGGRARRAGPCATARKRGAHGFLRAVQRIAKLKVNRYEFPIRCCERERNSERSPDHDQDPIAHSFFPHHWSL
jgi:hypothetical protein